MKMAIFVQENALEATDSNLRLQVLTEVKEYWPTCEKSSRPSAPSATSGLVPSPEGLRVASLQRLPHLAHVPGRWLRSDPRLPQSPANWPWDGVPRWPHHG